MRSVYRFILLISLGLTTTNPTSAQWVEASGSGGGYTYGITSVANSSGGMDLLAGTSGGGVIKSSDYGATWSPANTGLANLDVRCLLVSSNGSGSILFAGTNGGGVFASSNLGASWSLVNGGLTNGYVKTLAVLGPKLFAGTDGGGIFCSTNNGGSWSLADSGLNNTTVNSLVVAGTNLFAATNGGGVFLSTDNGISWTAVNSGLPNNFVWALAVSPNENGIVSLYAATNGALFRSTDSGTSWQSTGLTEVNTGYHGISTMIFSDTNLIVGTSGSGMFVSSDGGTEWRWMGIGYGNNYIYSLAASPNGVGNVDLYAGTDYGIFRSTDSGLSWRGVNSKLGYAQCFETSGSNLFVGTPGGGVFASSNSGRDWHSASHGLPPYTLPTHSDRSYIIYALAKSGGNVFAATQDGVYLSIDSGATWNGVNNGLPDITWPDHNWVHALIFSGTNLFAGTYYGGVFLSTNNAISWTSANTGLTTGDDNSLAACGMRLFAGTRTGVFVSTNNGTNWTSAQAPFPGFSKIVEVDTDLYAGTQTGVFRSINNGTSWTALNYGLTDTVIQSFQVCHNNGSTSLFAGTSNNGVFCSINGGKRWTAVNEGLPQDGVVSMTASDTNIFIGTGNNRIWRRSLLEIARSLASQCGSLQVTVQNIPGYGIVSSDAAVALDDKEHRLVLTRNTDSLGSVRFDSVQADTGYSIQVNYMNSNPAKIYGDEYWGKEKRTFCARGRNNCSYL